MKPDCNTPKLGSTARDIYLKIALDKEILRAKEAEAGIIDDSISEMSIAQEGKNITLSLINNKGEIVSSVDFSLDAKILINIVFDYANKKFIFIFDDGSTLECSIEEFIDYINNNFVDLKEEMQTALNEKVNIPTAPTDGKFYVLTSANGVLNWIEVNNIVTL